MIVYIVSQGLQGSLSGCIFLTTFTLGVEFVGPSKRNFAGFGVMYFFSIGYFYIVLFAYFIRNWRHLALVLYVPAYLFGLYYFILPESFRWLLSRRRTEEAEKLIRSVSMTNINSEPDDETIKSVIEDKEETSVSSRTYTPIDMVRTWKRAALTANVCFNWMVNGMVYYGLALNSEGLGGDLYLNFTLMGAIEFPAYTLAVFLIDKIGRRKSLTGFMVLGGVACIVSGSLPSDLHWLIVTLAILGKMGISASFVVIYVVTAEVYPTVMRIIALGLASTFARVGSALAPQVVLLKEPIAALPFIILGAESIIAGLLSLLLPETVRRDLPQNLEEFDNLLASPREYEETKPKEKKGDDEKTDKEHKEEKHENNKEMGESQTKI
ncbi:organic cation transporter protein [Lingula anatina]|uniref:Organic cation transporter protein n=1 Tax=Lingula anatina TaxID=7574 RepID=A0A1S3H6X4_LINAN|nr:organic cation transporter protein [Lingula anatina]|eukprot:XP_013381231.1 organic cation transporter protein [Lingula anatina]